jgi:hypothetical protein
MATKSKPCEWTTQKQAFAGFAGFNEKTQSAGHIKPLHWYVACRLVVEGGFDPDDIKPRPPFEIGSKRAGLPLLEFDEVSARGGEATVLGGLKTKSVDVVVTRDGIGPVLAVSCKGTTGAFRNLTNRMEELIGDCTNLHISYPTLVLGYLHLLRANRRVGEVVDVIEPGEDGSKEEDARGQDEARRRQLSDNDMAFDSKGDVTSEIKRFEIAVSRLAGRSGIRDDLTRYESIGLGLIESEQKRLGDIVAHYPDPSRGLNIDGFFDRLYAQYDERFIYGAPKLETVTRRLQWSPDSPALKRVEPDYSPKLGTPTTRTTRA